MALPGGCGALLLQRGARRGGGHAVQGHVHDRRDPAGRSRARGAGKTLPGGAPRFVHVHVRVDEPRQHYARPERLGARGPGGRLDLHDAPAGDAVCHVVPHALGQHGAARVVPAHGPAWWRFDHDATVRHHHRGRKPIARGAHVHLSRCAALGRRALHAALLSAARVGRARAAAAPAGG